MEQETWKSMLIDARKQPPKLQWDAKAAMKIGGLYNWRHQPDQLVYLGKKGNWHQFKKIGDPRAVWCEVLDEDLHMIEETPATTRRAKP